jgi:hypothetical protein
MTKKENIPAEVVAAIAAALGRYLKEDRLQFHSAPTPEPRPAGFSLWALAGRTDIMNGYRRKR